MKNIWLIALISIVFGAISCSKKNDDVTRFTVTFDAVGGSPIPENQTVEAGGTVTAPATNPAKSGYVFMSWCLNGVETAYNFNTPVTNNITLYAKWKEEATVEYWQVTWNLNGGTWPSSGDNHASQVVKGGTLSEPNAPVKSNYTLEGWYKESDLTNKVSFPYDVSAITDHFTLYAKWATVENPSSVKHNISSATEWNAAIAAVNAAGNNKTHTFTITKSFDLPASSATIFTKDLAGLTVTVRGQGDPAPEISLASNSKGYLIYFSPNEPQKIIFENVILKGHATNTRPLVRVYGEELVLGNGARITGNTNTDGYGAGVHVGVGGRFILAGGEISGNAAGTFSNGNGKGGGVYMSDFGKFVMNDGNISGNFSYGQGGGVYVGLSANLSMTGGNISGNTAMAKSGARGGGIYNSYGELNIGGGTITGYNQKHGDDIDIAEHYSGKPELRDDCNAVVITATAMGTYGAAFYSAVSNGNFYGVFEERTFTQTGSLGSKRERDLTVIDGVLQ